MSRTRSGSSLIEISFVLTILSVVWLAITTVLYTLYQADHRIRDTLTSEQSLNRFALKLRSDVHAAGSVKLQTNADNSTELNVNHADGSQVVYRFLDGNLQRITFRNDSPKSRDIFVINCGEATWSIVESEAASIVTARLESLDRKTQATRLYIVKAALTSDLGASDGAVEASS